MEHHITFTGVYGPTSATVRRTFFQELEEIKPNADIQWILCGDFNTTMDTQDRNSNTQDWRWPLAFTNLIQDLELQDIRMNGRRYTWSNTRQQPAMAKLDRFLFSTQWISQFPNTKQRTLPNTNSDHCPVMIEALTNFKRSKVFRFEMFWFKIQGFTERVTDEWRHLQGKI